MSERAYDADVCFILEGTYPYIIGGVSQWAHDLILAQSELTFHVVAILPPWAELTLKYERPKNLKEITNLFIHGLPDGESSFKKIEDILQEVEGPLQGLETHGGLAELSRIISIIKPYRERLGKRLLLNSMPAWRMLKRMYHARQPESSFLNYFWTWRFLVGGLYAVLLSHLPLARVYHSASTGFAGLFAARAHLETGRPAILTEHGIYTSERRIEITMADWLFETSLRDVWTNTFSSYARACYEASSKIITLYYGNQPMQIEGGAAPEKLAVIPNGVEYEKYASIKQDSLPHPPTAAFIGRVVPMKDVKTFIRACAIIHRVMPDFLGLILGPTDEDRDYFRECESMVNHLGIQDAVIFKGRVRIIEYLNRIDVNVLTSISENMPLVILEAGAAGIPTVATDVGACREMIYGSSNEEPQLGAGGVVTPLSNPAATAEAVLELLIDRERYKRCSNAIRERIRRYYNKKTVDKAYHDLYKYYSTMP